MPHPAKTNKNDAISEDLRRKWADANLTPLWESANGMSKPSQEEPQHWAWNVAWPILLETTEIALQGLERRVIQMTNKSIPSNTSDATAGMMNAALQAIAPGENTTSHRHSMNALRFILEGSGAETIVNGKPCLMQAGDLVLTPAWTWHEHRNLGSRVVAWLDILDVSLHHALGTVGFEPGPPHDIDVAPDDVVFSVAGVLPALPGGCAQDYSPMFRYPFEDVVAALALAPVAADGSRSVRYANPLSGGPCMPLIDCCVLEISAGQETIPFRTSASTILSVVEGSGISHIGDRQFSWSGKDTLTIPHNTWASHKAVGAPARIFFASNRDVFRRLGLLREESRK